MGKPKKAKLESLVTIFSIVLVSGFVKIKKIKINP